MRNGSDQGKWKSYVYNGKGEQVEHIGDKVRKFVAFGPDFMPIGYFEQTYVGHTYFLYGPGGQLLGEYNDYGTSVKEYAYGPTGRVAEFDSAGAIYLHHNDHLGTPQVITDMNLTPVWKADYKPFGEVIENRDPDGNGVLFTNNLRFPGQRWDEVAQLSYNYFRNYDPTTGRYTQHDPIGLNGGMNPFAYVGGNPVNLFDSKGLFLVSLGGTVRIPSWIKYVFHDFIGQGGSAGFAFQLTDNCGNFSPDFGVYWAFQGGGEDFGIGRAAINLGFSLGEISDLAGNGADVSAHYGMLGATANFQETSTGMYTGSRFDGATLDIGLGYNIGTSGSVGGSLSIGGGLQTQCNCH